MVDLLTGQRSASAARLVAKERKLEPAHAPIHRLQEEGKDARENADKRRNARSDRAKVRN